MEVINDNGCSWINDLNPRSNIKILETNKDCEWLIVGAGYTGLSAARKLGQLFPNQTSIDPSRHTKSRPPFSLGTRGYCPQVISILAGDFVEIVCIFLFFEVFV